MTAYSPASASGGTSSRPLLFRIARLRVLLRRRDLTDAEVVALWQRQQARAEAKSRIDDIVQTHLRAGLTLR